MPKNSGKTIIEAQNTLFSKILVWLVRMFALHSDGENTRNIVVKDFIYLSSQGTNSAIHHAVDNDDLAEAEKLLRIDPALASAPGLNLMTPLHSVKSMEMARLLLQYGADVSRRNQVGNPPIFNIIRSKNLALVNLLIKHGADVHAIGLMDNTTLHEAMDPEILNRLLDLNVSVNAQNSNGYTPLHHTIWDGFFSGNLEMIRILLEYGADVTIHDQLGRNALQYATFYGKIDILRALEQHVTEHSIELYKIPEKLISKRVVANPGRQEAISIVDYAILARWDVSEGAPRSVKQVYTRHIEIAALAAAPDGQSFAIVGDSIGLEIRDWDTLEILKNIDVPPDSSALAFSPDGHRLAVSHTGMESVNIINMTTGQIIGEIDGGERTASVNFDSTSKYVASACSFQGGGYISLNHINNDGILEKVYKFRRSQYDTPYSEFVDRLVALAFSPDSRSLVLFETSRIAHDYRPEGWRGNLVAYSPADGSLQWQISIDARVTNDKRSLSAAGHDGGFFTQIAFINPETIACGSTAGNILFFERGSGKLIKQLLIKPETDVIGLAIDSSQKLLWVLLADGELTTVPLAD